MTAIVASSDFLKATIDLATFQQMQRCRVNVVEFEVRPDGLALHAIDPRSGVKFHALVPLAPSAMVQEYRRPR